ncbi:hypothetical protein OT109_15120 [Phycisphaeraceae bacterium D3-23]
MISLRWMVLLVAMGLVVGCGETDTPTQDADTTDADGSGDARDGGDGDVGAADDGGADDAPDLGSVLVGTWDAVEDQNGALRSGMLVFTYHADGTGTVVEEGGPPKTYRWTYDADAGTLHVETENEDLLFDATFAGGRLTLVMEMEGGDAMRLVMERMDAAGE